MQHLNTCFPSFHFLSLGSRVKWRNLGRFLISFFLHLVRKDNVLPYWSLQGKQSEGIITVACKYDCTVCTDDYCLMENQVSMQDLCPGTVPNVTGEIVANIIASCFFQYISFKQLKNHPQHTLSHIDQILETMADFLLTLFREIMLPIFSWMLHDEKCTSL